MKKLYITLGLLVALSGFAQNKDTAKADKLFSSYQYSSAIKEYESLVKKKKADTYVYKQLAESYYNLNNTDKAAQYYAQVVRSKGDQDVEIYYNYAQVLKNQGKYEEANKQLDKFASLAPNDSRAIAYKSNPNYVQSLQALPKLFEVTETKINSSDGSDFGAVLGDNNILHFASTRSGRKDKKNTGATYLDIFQSVYSADGTLSEPTSVSALNTKYNDGPATLSKDGNTMFYSSEGEVAKDKGNNARIGKVGIYRAEKKDGKWKNIKALPFNSKEYNAGNPTLSKDGKTLYFESDMPGGFGDSDIWKVTVNSNGSYGKPENLGPKVNTEGREGFPFIADDGTLYFASNGKPGFGGLDVFKLESGASVAVNLGQPVNSSKDDFAFTFNEGKEIGFVSSNRKGSDNIYYVNPICGREALVIVKDARTGKVLNGASVSFIDSSKNTLETETTNSKGETSFHTECNKEYSLQASKDRYEPATALLEASKGGKTTTEILLNPIIPIITPVEVILNPIHFDFDKSDITAQGAEELDKLVKVMNEYPDMVIFAKSHTDRKGSNAYNDRLSERRAKSTVAYIISKGISKDRISGKGFGKREFLIDCGEDCTDEQDATNRRSEFLIVSGGPQQD